MIPLSLARWNVTRDVGTLDTISKIGDNVANDTKSAIEAAIAKNPLIQALATREAEKPTHGLETTAKPTVKAYALTDVVCITGLNPRLDFPTTELQTSIAAEGQREPVTLYHLSGEALAFARTFNPKVDEKTLVVVRGERRHRAISANRKEFAELRPNVANPFDTILGEFRGTISTRKAMVVEYHDNIARQNLDTRSEEARSVGQFRDAGWKLESIAQFFGQSIGWVQTRMRVVNLPNTKEYPLRDMVEKYDLTRAKVSRGELSKDALDGVVKLSDKAVKELESAFRWKTLGAWKLAKNETQPQDFDKLYAETVKTKGANFDAEAKPADISRDEAGKMLVWIAGNAAPKYRDAMRCVVDVLLGNAPKETLATFAGK